MQKFKFSLEINIDPIHLLICIIFGIIVGIIYFLLKNYKNIS